MLRRHRGDANVDLRPRRLQPRRAVLRQTPFRDVEAGENLDARNRAPAAARRPGAGIARKQAVDAHAHVKPVAKRLDVDIACAQFDRLFDEVVDRAHDGRAAGRDRADCRRFPRRRRAPLARPPRRRRSSSLSPQNARDVLERGDDDFERRRQTRVRGLQRLRVGGIARPRAPDFAVAGLERKYRRLAQKPRRETIGERTEFLPTPEASICAGGKKRRPRWRIHARTDLSPSTMSSVSNRFAPVSSRRNRSNLAASNNPRIARWSANSATLCRLRESQGAATLLSIFIGSADSDFSPSSLTSDRTHFNIILPSVTGCDISAIEASAFKVDWASGIIGWRVGGAGSSVSRASFRLRRAPGAARCCASAVAFRPHPTEARIIRTPTTPFAGRICSPRFPQATANADTATPERRAASFYGSPGGGRGGQRAARRGRRRRGRRRICVELREYACRHGRQSHSRRHPERGLRHRPARAGHHQSVLRPSGRQEATCFSCSRTRLRANNLVLVRDTVRLSHSFRPTDGSFGSVDTPARTAVEPGYGLTVIPVALRVGRRRWSKLLEGFATRPGTIRTDPTGQILLVLGTGSERQTAIDTVRKLRRRLAARAIGRHLSRPQQRSPSRWSPNWKRSWTPATAGLAMIWSSFRRSSGRTPILVVASKPELLRTAPRWIETAGQLGRREHRGQSLQGPLRRRQADRAAAHANIRPAAAPRATRSAQPDCARFRSHQTLVDDRSPDRRAPQISDNAQRERRDGSAAWSGRPRVRADAEFGGRHSTASLGPLARKRTPAAPAAAVCRFRACASPPMSPTIRFSSTPSEENYRIIERALQSARPAAIAGRHRRHHRRGHAQRRIELRRPVLPQPIVGTVRSMQCRGHCTSPITPALPGSTSSSATAASPKLILNALHQYTDVKILSNPSLVVVDNQEATLEVGDQVPISTGSATVLSANNAVVNTIDYKNTGIILNVKPRVNSNGTVLLDIEQEISNVPPGSSSATAPNLTPTISRAQSQERTFRRRRTDRAAGRVDQRNAERHAFRHSDPRSNSGRGQRILAERRTRSTAPSSSSSSARRSSAMAPTLRSSPRNCGRRCAADNWLARVAQALCAPAKPDDLVSEAASRAPSAPGLSLQSGDDAPRVRARRSGIRFGWGFAGAGVCAASYALAPGIEGLFGAALGLLMLGVASSDARRFIVPDVLSGGAFALGMIHAVATSPEFRFLGRPDGSGPRGFGRRIVMARASWLSALSRTRRSRARRCEIGRGRRRVAERAGAAHGD